MRIINYTYPAARSFVPASAFAGRSPYAGLESQIDRLFDSAVAGFVNPAPFAVDLYEDKDNAYVRAELPGVTREDVAVEIVEGDLRIQASRKAPAGEAGETVSLSRSVTLPDEVQADRVTAAYLDGVLTVTLPKREAAKPRKVTVSVN
jgi:HSP20 family protein